MTTSDAVNGPLSTAEADLATRAIQRCIMDYCHGIDRCDADLVTSVYHPDGTDDHGSFVGLGSDFATLVTEKLRTYAISTTHFCGVPTIDFVSPTLANVETQVLAWHRVRGADGEFLEKFGGRYFDRFECRAGDWRIAHRALTHDWDTKEVVVNLRSVNRWAPSPRLGENS